MTTFDIDPASSKIIAVSKTAPCVLLFIDYLLSVWMFEYLKTESPESGQCVPIPNKSPKSSKAKETTESAPSPPPLCFVDYDSDLKLRLIFCKSLFSVVSKVSTRYGLL